MIPLHKYRREPDKLHSFKRERKKRERERKPTISKPPYQLDTKPYEKGFALLLIRKPEFIPLSKYRTFSVLYIKPQLHHTSCCYFSSTEISWTASMLPPICMPTLPRLVLFAPKGSFIDQKFNLVFSVQNQNRHSRYLEHHLSKQWSPFLSFRSQNYSLHTVSIFPVHISSQLINTQQVNDKR